MSEVLFQVFPSENFIDLGLYQFGWEQMQQMKDMGLFLRGVKTKLKNNGDDYYGIIHDRS